MAINKIVKKFGGKLVKGNIHDDVDCQYCSVWACEEDMDDFIEFIQPTKIWVEYHNGFPSLFFNL